MSTHRNFDKICCVVLTLVLVITLLFMNGEKLGIQAVSAMQYEEGLFDDSRVHTVNIEMDNWDAFLESCENEEYEQCSVTIDGETYRNVGIRAKGNTSLSSVKTYGNNRYSFKIEFDRYDNGESYYGLDKICLNNIIQDNTFMKDYLVYKMMRDFGAVSPLCSFVYITVNGEDWGLYLAVEGVEESFLERNYGNDYGELYKPDSMSFDKEDMERFFDGENEDEAKNGEITGGAENGETENEVESGGSNDDGAKKEEASGGENGGETQNNGKMDFGRMKPPGGDESADAGRGFAGGPAGGDGSRGGPEMKSDDVSLIYTDDEYESYSNIFDNAKTDINDTDKERLIASLKKLNEGSDIEDVVNVEEVIRYFVVHNFVCNFDSYTGSMIHNYYLYEDDGKLSMIPWDYNLAFGGFQMGPLGSSDSPQATELVNYPIDTPVSGGTVESRPMLAWIFSDEGYTQLYHQYFSDFIEQYFDSGYFEQLIDSVTQMIAPYVEKDPTKFCTYEEFETGAATLSEFCLLRAESVRGQLDGSIPSDSDGQSADSTALIDASSLTISDMGDMGMTMGGRGGPGDGQGVPGGAFGDDAFGNGDEGGGQGIPNKSFEDETFGDENSRTGRNDSDRNDGGESAGD